MLLVSRSETPYHHGNLAPALEDAALELMRAHGHTSLSLREVARAAGVSHNAPYHHFGDRVALLMRLSERCMAELLAALQAAERSAKTGNATAADARREATRAHSRANSAEARAVRIGCAYVGYAADYPERFRVIYDPEVCVPGSPSEAMAPLIQQVEVILAGTAAALLPAGQAATSIGAMTTAVWGAVHGLAELVVAGHIERDDVESALMALVGATPHGR